MYTNHGVGHTLHGHEFILHSESVFTVRGVECRVLASHTEGCGLATGLIHLLCDIHVCNCTDTSQSSQSEAKKLGQGMTIHGSYIVC